MASSSSNNVSQSSNDKNDDLKPASMWQYYPPDEPEPVQLHQPQVYEVLFPPPLEFAEGPSSILNGNAVGQSQLFPDTSTHHSFLESSSTLSQTQTDGIVTQSQLDQFDCSINSSSSALAQYMGTVDDDASTLVYNSDGLLRPEKRYEFGSPSSLLDLSLNDHLEQLNSVYHYWDNSESSSLPASSTPEDQLYSLVRPDRLVTNGDNTQHVNIKSGNCNGSANHEDSHVQKRTGVFAKKSTPNPSPKKETDRDEAPTEEEIQFRRRRLVNKHLQKEKNQEKLKKNPNSKKCEICGNYYSNPSTLIRHQVILHNMRPINYKQVLLGYARETAKVKCTYCQKFVSKKSLRAHEFKVHGIIKGNSSPSVASLTIKEKSAQKNLLKRLRRNFRTDYKVLADSNKAFAKSKYQPLILIENITIHLANRNQTNPQKRQDAAEMRTGNSFSGSTSTDFNSSQTSDRDCAICNKTFASKGSLQAHQVTIHNLKIPNFKQIQHWATWRKRLPRETCNICGATLQNKYVLRNHQRKVHNLNIPRLNKKRKGTPSGSKFSFSRSFKTNRRILKEKLNKNRLKRLRLAAAPQKKEIRREENSSGQVERMQQLPQTQVSDVSGSDLHPNLWMQPKPALEEIVIRQPIIKIKKLSCQIIQWTTGNSIISSPKKTEKCVDSYSGNQSPHNVDKNLDSPTTVAIPNRNIRTEVSQPKLRGVDLIKRTFSKLLTERCEVRLYDIGFITENIIDSSRSIKTIKLKDYVEGVRKVQEIRNKHNNIVMINDDSPSSCEETNVTGSDGFLSDDGIETIDDDFGEFEHRKSAELDETETYTGSDSSKENYLSPVLGEDAIFADLGDRTETEDEQLLFVFDNNESGSDSDSFRSQNQLETSLGSDNGTDDGLIPLTFKKLQVKAEDVCLRYSKCPLCEDLVQVKDMATHKNAHVVQCHICGGEIPVQEVAKHGRTHVARLQCEVCGFKGSTRIALWEHMNSHFGVKPLFCLSCGYSTGKCFALNIHSISQHTNIHRYTCQHCPKKFQTLSSKACHELSHYGNKCPNCEQTFDRKGKLKHHLKMVHQNKIGSKKLRRYDQTLPESENAREIERIKRGKSWKSNNTTNNSSNKIIQLL